MAATTRALAALAALLVAAAPAAAFYLPGVAPQDFAQVRRRRDLLLRVHRGRPAPPAALGR